MNIKIKYIPALAALALGATTLMTSCDDYLDVTNGSAFSNEEIFSNVEDTKASMATVYAMMCNGNLYGQAFPLTFNLNTDVELKEYASKDQSVNGGDVGCFDPTPNWSNLASTWNQAYKAINYANDFIENMVAVGNIEMTDVQLTNPTEMQQMYGEVRCLRALMYFDLVRTFGDVVFKVESAKAGDDFYYTPVTNRDDIYAWLINDLKDAEHYMKYAKNIDEGVQRASREFCQALIGQMALYRGGWQLRDGGTDVGHMERRDDWMNDYRTAKTYLGKVIKEGMHSLSKESYEQMWVNEMNFSALNDGDVIFEVPLQKENSGTFGYNIGVVIDFDSNSPHQYGVGKNGMTFCGLYPFTFDQRDLRLDVTCVPYKYNSEMHRNWGLTGKCVGAWGCGKWDKTKVSKDNALSTTEGNTGVNNIRLRYADVLLMYAEVCNELGEEGDAMTIKECLKTVRRRAFESALHAECVDQYVDALSGHDAIFDAIKNERAWEFGGEGVRKYDLARWNLYGKTIKATYNEFVRWAHAAEQGSDDFVRDLVRVRFEDPNDETSQVLEWRGLKEWTEEEIGECPPDKGWKTKNYANNWLSEDKDLDRNEIISQIRYSFRGYINFDNADAVTGEEPLRYLMPYPSTIISSHRGSIKQMYGYR